MSIAARWDGKGPTTELNSGQGMIDGKKIGNPMSPPKNPAELDRSTVHQH